MNAKSNNLGLKGRTVLIVNDNPEAVELMRLSMKNQSLHVVSARNTAQAMNKARRVKPNLIILDTGLADSGALDFCRQLNENNVMRQIPIMLTGTEIDYEDIMSALAAGAHDYIAKLSDPSNVVALLETQLARLKEKDNTDSATKLLNFASVKKMITSLISQGKNFALMYVDIHSLDAFTRVYGSSQANHVVRLIVNVVSDSVQHFGDESDLVAQPAPHTLAVLTTPERAETLCTRIISDFENQMQSLHQSIDKLQSYAGYKSKRVQREKSPIVKLSISVVTNDKRRIRSYAEVESVGAELRNHVKGLPDNTYFFDRRNDMFGTGPGKYLKKRILLYRTDIGAIEDVLSRVALLTDAIEPGITTLKSALNSLMGARIETLNSRQIGNLQLIKKRADQLLNMLNELKILGGHNRGIAEISLARMSLKEIINLVVLLAQISVKDRGVRVSINVKDNVSQPIIIDHAGLVLGLFYLLRNEIKSGAPGHPVLVSASHEKNGSVSAEIMNPKHYITNRSLELTRGSALADLIGDEQRIQLHLAILTVEGLGGELKISSKRRDGTTFILSIPSKWHSRIDRINKLQSERQKIGRASRAQIEKIRDFLSSSSKRVSADMRKSLKAIEHRVWELEVLNNLALLMADDSNGELERQQQEHIKHDVERHAVLESILVFMKQIAVFSQAGGLFDLRSARRTSRYALAIASGLKLPRDEKQTIHYAAMLKDLGLAFAPSEFLGVIEGLGIDEQDKFRHTLLNNIEALSRLDFLGSAMSLLSHKYERFDGTGYPSGLIGKKIPIGARILTVAEAFDNMTYGLWPLKESDQDTTMKQIIADSGRRFDPQLVTIFLRAWRAEKLSA